MRVLANIAAIVAMYVALIGSAYGWELIRQPNGYSTLATLGMRLEGGLRVALNIDFDVRQACRPSVGVLEFRGARLGTPMSSIQQSGSLRISVGGAAYTVTPYVVQYDNGLERMQFVTQSLVNRIASGVTPIQVQVDGGRTYEFPIDRDTQAIRTAQQICLGSR